MVEMALVAVGLLVVLALLVVLVVGSSQVNPVERQQIADSRQRRRENHGKRLRAQP